jgi:hypothetical protein
MPQAIVEFKEVAGKTVEKITLTNESDFRAVTIRFTDRTAMHFTLRSKIDVSPELLDWKTGNGEVIRTYPRVEEAK